MKFLIFAILGFLIIASSPQVFAVELTMYTNQQIYTTQHPLLVYGTGPENAPLVVRLLAPDGSIAEFQQITTNSDGSFSYKILDWPDSSTQYPFGTYTVEVLTNIGQSQKIDIKFASSTELELIPIERRISTQVFAPEMAAADRPFRVFVQVTTDGLLVAVKQRKYYHHHIYIPLMEKYKVLQCQLRCYTKGCTLLSTPLEQKVLTFSTW